MNKNLENIVLAPVYEVGTFKMDFEVLKTEIVKLADSYSMTQYSDDVTEVIKEMKSDRAELNKMKKAFDEKRIDAKNAYMVPYQKFEVQVKELIEKLDVPCRAIDAKIKDLEETAREKKREAINAYWEQISVSLDDETKQFLYKKLYNPSWENVTATQKAYKEGLQNGIDNYVSGMNTIKGMSDYVEEGIKKFKETLSLSDAIAEIQRLKKQKEEIIAKERERLEREQQIKLEAERRRIEAEALEKARKEAQAERDEALKTQEKMEKKAAVPIVSISNPQASPKKVIAIRMIAGTITNVYCSDSSFEVEILDDDMASQRGILDFEKLVSTLNEIA